MRRGVGVPVPTGPQGIPVGYPYPSGDEGNVHGLSLLVPDFYNAQAPGPLDVGMGLQNANGLAPQHRHGEGLASLAGADFNQRQVKLQKDAEYRLMLQQQIEDNRRKKEEEQRLLAEMKRKELEEILNLQLPSSTQTTPSKSQYEYQNSQEGHMVPGLQMQQHPGQAGATATPIHPSAPLAFPQQQQAPVLAQAQYHQFQQSPAPMPFVQAAVSPLKVPEGHASSSFEAAGVAPSQGPTAQVPSQVCASTVSREDYDELSSLCQALMAEQKSLRIQLESQQDIILQMQAGMSGPSDKSGAKRQVLRRRLSEHPATSKPQQRPASFSSSREVVPRYPLVRAHSNRDKFPEEAGEHEQQKSQPKPAENKKPPSDLNSVPKAKAVPRQRWRLSEWGAVKESSAEKNNADTKLKKDGSRASKIPAPKAASKAGEQPSKIVPPKKIEMKCLGGKAAPEPKIPVTNPTSKITSVNSGDIASRQGTPKSERGALGLGGGILALLSRKGVGGPEKGVGHIPVDSTPSHKFATPGPSKSLISTSPISQDTVFFPVLQEEASLQHNPFLAQSRELEGNSNLMYTYIANNANMQSVRGDQLDEFVNFFSPNMPSIKDAHT